VARKPKIVKTLTYDLGPKTIAGRCVRVHYDGKSRTLLVHERQVKTLAAGKITITQMMVDGAVFCREAGFNGATKRRRRRR
jgi:hypothetical protein